MIRREHKILKFFLVLMMAVLTTGQGKKNLAWFVSQSFDTECNASWLLIDCH